MPQHDGFHDLLTTALPRLRTHARALTRNPTAADDLVQDAVAAWFETGSHVKLGWCCRDR